jgi:hypothetical protein
MKCLSSIKLYIVVAVLSCCSSSNCVCMHFFVQMLNGAPRLMNCQEE